MKSEKLEIFKSALPLLPFLMIIAGCKGGGGGWGGGFSMPPMPVETDVATIRPVSDRFEAVGSLEADASVMIVSEIGGIVTSLPFPEGGAVARGDLIAQLDDRELKADFDRASAIRDQSQTDFNRVKTIVDQGAGTAQDLDAAAMGLKVAEANVSGAKARLDKTRITAPFGGLVGARRVSPGAYLRPGDPITELAQIQTLRVTFSVPERFLAELKQGSEITVSSPSFPNYELKGKIEVIEPVLDSGTRSARIVGRVPNVDRKFRPGMSANVAAVLAVRPAALTISSEALLVDQNQTYVYLIKSDSSVTRTAVQLGTRLPDVVEITGGLQEGQRVVRTGHQKIFEGSKVIPMMAPPAAASLPPGGSGR